VWKEVEFGGDEGFVTSARLGLMTKDGGRKASGMGWEGGKGRKKWGGEEGGECGVGGR